ncbi:hypothetical protein JCM17845_21280 [Iodidimonas gelatinilytica]|uniref:histidine kinase n=2 Tax=Iodidimonas gelatinilytica TaxID=1236966 RepID=A0A5A7N1A9_9PROT|nr:hypothetical protein JCM17845_21280 [Iodidimonas gelatinilytica]
MVPDCKLTRPVHSDMSLRATSEQLTNYFELVSHGMCIFDSSLRFLWANRQFRDLMEYPASLCKPGTSIDAFVAFDCRRGLYGSADPAGIASELKIELSALYSSRVEIQLPNDQIIAIDRRRADDGAFVFVCTNITSTKRNAERSNQDSTIIRHLADAVVLTDLQYRIIFKNPAYLKLFGVILEEKKPHYLPPHDMTAHISYEHFIEDMEHAISTLGRYEFELILPLRNGDQKTIHGTLMPRRDRSANHVGYIGLYHDATHHAKDRHRLDRQDRVIAQLTDSVVVADHAGRVLDCNPATAKIFGYSFDELKGKPFLEIIRPIGDQEEAARIAAETLRSGQSWYGELSLRHKDGHIVIADCIVQPFYDENGKHIGRIGIHRDITERHRAKMEIHRQNLIIEHMWEGVIVTDCAGEVVKYNASANRILGLGSETPESKKARDLLQDIAQQVAQYGRYEGAYQLGEENGGFIHMECLAMPVLDQAGKIDRVVSVHRDVTDRVRNQQEQKAQAERLERSRRLETLGRIAGGIAHDFNNLLTPVLGYAHLAKADLPEGSQPKNDIMRVISGMEKARDMVRQILTFGQRIDAPKQPEHFDTLIASNLDLLEGSLSESIKVVWKPGCGDAVIACNKTAIGQILMNLCWNAAQAMPEGGTLLIETDQGGDWSNIKQDHDLDGTAHVRLLVGDTGPGIEQSNIDLIFEPFFTTKNSGNNTGLGLSVVHGIVRAHGGVITASNRQPKGACFEVFLPQYMDASGESRPQQAPGANDARHGRGETILIVDDDDDVRELMARMLLKSGFTPLSASNGFQAYELLEKNPDIRLVLTDLNMPGMTGDQLARKIRDDGRSIPILLMSAIIDARIVRDYQSWGVHALLHKPIIPDDLIHELFSHINPTKDQDCAEENIC